MEVRYQHSPNEVRQMDTSLLRDNFLIRDLMQENKVSWVYTHYDRVMVGGVVPLGKQVKLDAPQELRTEHMLDRRELGIVNVGEEGSVVVDGKEYSLGKLDCLYVGRDSKELRFSSKSKRSPARFYLMCVPAHKKYPNKLMRKEQAMPAPLGDGKNSNKRIIFKYIHPDGIQSCQLVMGVTVLQDGNVWNSFPPHTHDRRMEVYFYFDLPSEEKVFHFMGKPEETRHVTMGNNEAIISPPWSVHYGCGTSNYSFIWGMAGENQVFADMDHIVLEELK